MNANVTGGVDAGDLVTHAIVVENRGRGLHGAFNVEISDAVPAGYEIPATPAELNLHGEQPGDIFGGGRALAHRDGRGQEEESDSWSCHDGGVSWGSAH